MASNEQKIERLLKLSKPTIQQLMDGLELILAKPDVPPKARKAAASVRGERHMAWLKTALQTATTLEFATIPPYLCALWSIKDELHPAAKSIREVVQEEMLHMGMACNMLVSIGGQPKIRHPDFVPAYPGHIPGGVHPNLVVKLSGLTKQAVADFMVIERPSHVAIADEYGESEDLIAREAADDTIGAFYDCINNAFQKNKPEMSTDHQITGPLAWTVVRNLEDVDLVIEMIKDQGEGSEAGPKDTGLDDLAHYYRFEEIYVGRKLTWDAEKKAYVHGERLAFPDVWPMAVVPAGGYQQEDVSDDVWYFIHQFDKTYTKLLRLLQQTWRQGGQASFIHAIETMFKLEEYAKPLMKMPIPGGDGATYGPCFRLVDDEAD